MLRRPLANALCALSDHVTEQRLTLAMDDHANMLHKLAAVLSGKCDQLMSKKVIELLDGMIAKGKAEKQDEQRIVIIVERGEKLKEHSRRSKHGCFCVAAVSGYVAPPLYGEAIRPGTFRAFGFFLLDLFGSCYIKCCT